MPNLLRQRLHSVLHYDRDTGLFTWLKRISIRIKVGAQAGYLRSDGYLEISIGGFRSLAHRLAWFYVHDCWPTGQIDHVDMCKTNNSLSNLRECTHGQNVQNSGPRKNNKCGIKGVSFIPKRGKWHSRIMSSGELHLLGYFDTREEAANAYAIASKNLHGEFSRLTACPSN